MVGHAARTLSLLLVLAASSGAGTPPQPAKFLPAASAPKGLGSAGKILRYAPEDLHEYLDGAAPVLVEFGIVRVAIREWTGPERALAIHVYRMKDSLGAYALATYVRGPGTRPLALGDGGFERDRQLGFHKGRWFVQCDVQDGGEEVRSEARRLATAMAKVIPGQGARPLLLAVLRAPTLVARSEVLYRGRLALSTAEPFAGSLAGEGLVLAGSARYRQGKGVIRGLVADYTTAEMARGAFRALGRALKIEKTTGSRFVTKRGNERVTALLEGRRIRVVVK